MTHSIPFPHYNYVFDVHILKLLKKQSIFSPFRKIIRQKMTYKNNNVFALCSCYARADVRTLRARAHIYMH